MKIINAELVILPAEYRWVTSIIAGIVNDMVGFGCLLLRFNGEMKKANDDLEACSSDISKWQSSSKEGSKAAEADDNIKGLPCWILLKLL